MKTAKTLMQEIDRIIARENRRARRRQVVQACLDTIRRQLRRICSLHSWRRCRDCGARLGWHGYTDHIPF